MKINFKTSMFHTARLKLTGWYLLIIMLISIIFSVVIFVTVNRELERFEHFQSLRQERIESSFGALQLKPVNIYDSKLIMESRGRLIESLLLLNLSIMLGAGFAGYFLAGRTLTPIKLMLEEQNRFIGDASHELKTPLTALRSEIEVYLRSKKRSSKDADEILKSNLEEVIRLQNLSDGLIALTRFEESNVKAPAFTKLLITEPILNALKKVGSLAQEKNIIITNDIAKVHILGEEKSLTHLFLILLDNAIKYSASGTKIHISTKKSTGAVTVNIKDQGIGMKSDDVVNIFERFYRADKSRSTAEVAGFGLGLSIAKQIVNIHGGTISVKSKIGVGSTFTVIFPLVN